MGSFNIGATLATRYVFCAAIDLEKVFRTSEVSIL
jgi:hypothetical protein